MGFWRRLFTSGQDNNTIMGPLGSREDSDTPHQGLVEDPRERAQALHRALELAREFNFTPRREITVDDAPFDRLGGIQAFNAEPLSTLLQLRDPQGPLFPRTFYFEYDFVNCNDAYARVLEEMAAAAGTREHFEDIRCDLHFGPDFHRQPLGEFRYLHRGRMQRHEVSSEGDFADPGVVAAMLRDVTPQDHALASGTDGAHNYWVPEDQARRFLTLLRAEERAAARRHQSWQQKQEADSRS